MSKTQINIAIGLLFVIAGCLVMVVLRTTPPPEPLAPAVSVREPVDSSGIAADDIRLQTLKADRAALRDLEGRIELFRQDVANEPDERQRRLSQSQLDRSLAEQVRLEKSIERAENRK